MSPRPRKAIDLDTFEGRFAWRLRVLREKAKLTVEEFAEKLGVTGQCVYDWEIGRSQPKISDLPKIAKAFGMKRLRDILPTG